jgi:hypothetical protein
MAPGAARSDDSYGGLRPPGGRNAGSLPGRAAAIKLCRNCRSLDITLKEIRELLRLRDLPQGRDEVRCDHLC